MDLTIRDVRLLDVDNDQEQPGTWNVDIRDGRIFSVYPCSELSSWSDHLVVPGHGAYLLPGLIDLHVHLVWDGGEDPVSSLASERPEQTLLRAVRHARETLEAGITTVRDLGSVHDFAVDLADAVNKGHIVGPRIFASGRTVIMTGGHDPFWGLMADGPDEVLKATRTQIYKGASVIKLSATGGVYGRQQGESALASELHADEIQVIVDEAHKHGIPVAAHAIGLSGIANAIQAGVDTIEHGHQLTEELAELLASQDGTMVPTLFVYQQIARLPGIPEYAQTKAKAIVDEHRNAVRVAREAKVRIGAGSDAGSPLTPHGALIDELESLVEAGLTVSEALRASTVDAARVLGQDGELGRIEPGYLGDLVLLDGNPLLNLGNLRLVIAVWKGGQEVYRRRGHTRSGKE